MRYSNLLIKAALLRLVIASPLDYEYTYAVKETHNVPSTFTRIGDALPDHRMRLSVGLKQSRFDELERHLWEVSDPDNVRYGQHLSQEDVNELIKPSEDGLRAVQEWLYLHVHPDTIEYSPARDFLTFVLPVADVEQMLKTKYATYRHQEGFELVRATEWSLPQHLHEHIRVIQPTTSFMRPYAQAKTFKIAPVAPPAVTAPLAAGESPSVEKVCNTSSVTPTCLRTLYGTINYVPQAGDKNQLAICDYLGEINNRSDAAIYLENFRPEALAGAQEFKQVSVHGGTLQQTPENSTQLKAGIGLEGGLDIQTVLGIAWPVPITAYSTGGSPPFKPDYLETYDENEPYLFWLQYILQQSFIPQTISSSYADDEQTVPLSYADTVCSMFAQLGARGVSFFCGSGDGGVTGVQTNKACTSNVSGKKEFIPLFPGGCPYVTTVGATVNFSIPAVAFDPSNGFVSGGGFSNYFGQPSYQHKAVESFLDKFGDTYAKYYNKSGRAYPDIAAYGVNETIAWNGTLLNLDGTSVATPVAASVISLVNDALIAAGKSPLGWLNPWLYKKGYRAFSDITHGNTMGCNTTGFPALEGWDAASGFGTPNFGEILKEVGCGGWGGGWQ